MAQVAEFHSKALVDEAAAGSKDEYLRACWRKLVRRGYFAQASMGEPAEAGVGFAYLQALDVLRTFRPASKESARRSAIGWLWGYGSKFVSGRGNRELERIQRQETVGLLLEDITSEHQGFESVERQDARRELLRFARATLNRREVRILIRRARGMSLHEIAEVENRTYERIRQIETGAIRSLRRLLASGSRFEPQDLGVCGCPAAPAGASDSEGGAS